MGEENWGLLICCKVNIHYSDYFNHSINNTCYLTVTHRFYIVDKAGLSLINIININIINNKNQDNTYLHYCTIIRKKNVLKIIESTWSQQSMQATWKKCKHGRSFNCSSASNDSRQILQVWLLSLSLYSYIFGRIVQWVNEKKK